MTDPVPPLTKKDSIVKLEKVLTLWKTKNVVSQFTSKKKSEDQTIMFLGRKISKRLIIPNSVEDITITSQRLCEEYIEARLSRSGMKEFDSVSNSQSEEYSNVLQNMGQILEMKYPKLYTKISVHLKLSYDSEIVVWDSFNKFATNLFSEGITWAKIIAFYAFAGGLALDCMAHRKNQLPGRIVYWFGVYVMKKLATWIQEQGGWSAIVDHFNTDSSDYYNNSDADESETDYDTKGKLKKMLVENSNQIKLFGIFIFGLFLCYIFLLLKR